MKAEVTERQMVNDLQRLGTEMVKLDLVSKEDLIDTIVERGEDLVSLWNFSQSEMVQRKIMELNQIIEEKFA